MHKRKVDDVRRWLTESFDGGKLKKFRVCFLNSYGVSRQLITLLAEATGSNRPGWLGQDNDHTGLIPRAKHRGHRVEALS